jgi:hypothetical protein
MERVAIESDGKLVGRGEQRALVDRVVQSETFRRSPRLRAFLLFVAEKTLGDASPDLTEYNIGRAVFERPESFSPIEDSIVRSSARQLRIKLSEYFAGEGAAESLLLEIPKGNYVAEFRWRPHAEIAAVPPRRWRRWGLAVGALLALLVVVFRVAWQPTAGSGSPVAGNLLFSVFREPATEINVVLVDSALALVNSLEHKILSLDDYVQKKEQIPLRLPPADPGLPAPPSFPGGRLITSFRDAVFAGSLAERAASSGHRVNLRHSRLMQARDFRVGNYVILGSIMSNPWAGLFEDRLNFRFSRDAETGMFGIRNTAPRSGERMIYSSGAAESRNGLSYARIANTSNLSGTGRVLLISGIHAESSEGATDAALSPELLAQVRSAASSAAFDAGKDFELLLELRSVDGTVRGWKLIATRFAR